MKRPRKFAGATLVGMALLGTGGGAAWAMSDGVYTPADQRCSEGANDTANAHTSEEGCQNATVYLKNGDWEIVRVGTLQTPEGTVVHEFVIDGDFDISQIDPARGAQVYFGADDNLDRGEHDGASGIGNGPSDGGGIRLLIDPASLAAWIAAMSAGDTGYLQTHPIPLVSFATGECADGICFAATTERRVIYQGGDTKAHRDAADYKGVRWDPETCGGPSATAADCDDPATKKSKKEDIRYWNDQVGTVYAEPGLQVYEDPDPEGSPIGPYPLPGAYVGTCGALVDDAGMTPAGQIDARQGCR
ncbi:MAG: hypothetical protein ABIY48_09795 [Acidimicrobiales bacterium]